VDNNIVAIEAADQFKHVRAVTAHVVCVFSEQDVLVAVSNNISITRFNNNADTANVPHKINLLPTNSVRTTTQLLLNFVENSVLVLHE